MTATGVALALVGIFLIFRTVRAVNGKTLVDHILGG
jgi:multisubunit Na+/H+ antiporter MnhF subunit